MSAPSVMTDIEFLGRSDVTQKNVLYLYRRNSGLLRRAVEAKVKGIAEQAGQKLSQIATYSLAVPELTEKGSEKSPGHENKIVEFPSLYMSMKQPSLFGTLLFSCDLGDRSWKRMPLDDLEDALWAVADDAVDHRLCLLIPEGHKVLTRQGWLAAVGKVGLVEEPMVTLENYRAIARSYCSSSRLGDLSYLSNDQRFAGRLKEFVKNGCTPFELSKQIDVIVLTEMEHGQFTPAAKKREERRERAVLPETLRKFLDCRDAASFSAMMVLIDRQRHELLLEPEEILTRLYNATKRTLESQDKRYRDPSGVVHVIWAVSLLSHEATFLKGNGFVAMDQLGQAYCRAAKDPNWFAGTDEWQTIARLVDIKEVRKPRSLDIARLGLQKTLRQRIHALNENALNWFQPVRNSIEDGDNLEVGNKEPAATLAKVE